MDKKLQVQSGTLGFPRSQGRNASVTDHLLVLSGYQVPGPALGKRLHLEQIPGPIDWNPRGIGGVRGLQVCVLPTRALMVLQGPTVSTIDTAELRMGRGRLHPEHCKRLDWDTYTLAQN